MLSAKLKEIRKEQGMTQKELAALIGVSVDSVRRWEHGERQPKANDLALFALRMGVTDLNLLFKEAF